MQISTGANLNYDMYYISSLENHRAPFSFAFAVSAAVNDVAAPALSFGSFVVTDWI